MQMKKPNRPSLLAVLRRCVRLRCPVCGQGRLFAGWFRMRPACDGCGLKYARAPGYFLGSIYFNYGVTAVLIVVVYFTVFLASRVAPDAVPDLLSPRLPYFKWLLAGVAALFPMWFFRYARSLWLGLDTYFDPVEEEPPDKNR